jgi:molecular chaperone GrpE
MTKQPRSGKKAATEAEPETIGVRQEVAALKQALAEAEAKAENNLANWQRAQADFINYKRRTEQEKEDIIQFANATLILDLLPSLDDLERALGSVPDELTSISWVDGIQLIWQKLQSILETQGLSEIKAVGEPFDPHLHEAVRQDSGEDGIVIADVQKGYRLRDKIIRPSKVVVGNGDEDKEV